MISMQGVRRDGPEGHAPAARMASREAEAVPGAPGPREAELHEVRRLANAGAGVRATAGYRAMLDGAAGRDEVAQRAGKKRKRGAPDEAPGEVQELDRSPRVPVSVPGKKAPERLGIGTFNINHLGMGSEKKEDKLDAIRHLMKSNEEWLDLLALQEVNDPEVLRELGGDVELLSPGPTLRTVGVSGRDATREVYPLVGRRNSGWTVEDTEVFNPGTTEPEAWDLDKDLVWRDRTEQGLVETELAKTIGPLPPGVKSRDAWYNERADKARKADEARKKGGTPKGRAQAKLFARRKELLNREDKRSRPVVIYRLKNNKDGRRVNVGVVHTTPSGQEFGRRDVFAQVSDFLDYVNTSVGANQEPGDANWVVLGDFYLTPEADVKLNANNRSRDKASSFGLHFPDPVAARVDDAPEPRYPHLALAHSITASNWPTEHRKRGKREKAQIADFMITSGTYQSRTAGVFDAYAEGIWPVDWDHRNLERWMPVTDHAPIGGMFSTAPDDARVERVHRMAENRAFPPEMRDLEGLLSPDELGPPPKRRRKAQTEYNPELSPSASDSFFFLEPGDPVPEGRFNQFTHDVPAMLDEFTRAASIEDEESSVAMERALGGSTSFSEFVDRAPRRHRRPLRKLSGDRATRIVLEHRRGRAEDGGTRRGGKKRG